jgi:hypothetical protein
MGVDWLVCKSKICGETFADCGDFVYCECGENWCSYGCAENDGFTEEYDEDCGNTTSCNFCREEDFDDGDLLKYLLRVASLTRGDLIGMYRRDVNNRQG